MRSDNVLVFMLLVFCYGVRGLEYPEQNLFRSPQAAGSQMLLK